MFAGCRSFPRITSPFFCFFLFWGSLYFPLTRHYFGWGPNSSQGSWRVHIVSMLFSSPGFGGCLILRQTHIPDRIRVDATPLSRPQVEGTMIPTRAIHRGRGGSAPVYASPMAFTDASSLEQLPKSHEWQNSANKSWLHFDRCACCINIAFPAGFVQMDKQMHQLGWINHLPIGASGFCPSPGARGDGFSDLCKKSKI